MNLFFYVKLVNLPPYKKKTRKTGDRLLCFRFYISEILRMWARVAIIYEMKTALETEHPGMAWEPEDNISF